MSRTCARASVHDVQNDIFIRVRHVVLWFISFDRKQRFPSFRTTPLKLFPPIYSYSFCLQTDAGELGAGAVLFPTATGSRSCGKTDDCLYANRKFSDAQKRHASY